MKNKIRCNVHPVNSQLPTNSFCRVSNNTMATASNLYLARSYLTFVKFHILTAMTVKLLTSSMWSSVFSFKLKNWKGRSIVFRNFNLLHRLILNEIPEENSFQLLMCSILCGLCTSCVTRHENGDVSNLQFMYFPR